MDQEAIRSALQALVPYVTTYGLQALGAVVILLGGKVGSSLGARIVVGLLQRAKADATVTSFVSSLVRYGILVFAVIAALAKFGVQTASFVAVLGAAGLAVGLALQGSLSNFAAGVLILLFRPFNVGDFVTIGGASGTVVLIGIFTTTLHSPDNQKIVVPNSAVTAGTIVNVTANETRRVDLRASIGYGDDIGKAKEVLEGIVAAHPKVLADPAPVVRVVELGESSVDFVVRPWVNTPDYWDVYFDLTRAIKEEFDKAGICIPFPQRDVHLYRSAEA